LEDLGINYTQSSRWQEEATVPEETFVDWVSQVVEKGDGVTRYRLEK
jgi:hypothetical protein